MSLDGAALSLLWQLGWLLLGGLLVATSAIALAGRLRWPASQPLFWWIAIGLIVLPAWLARAVPEGLSLPAEALHW